jgi:hypothetical protein
MKEGTVIVWTEERRKVGEAKSSGKKGLSKKV